MFLRYYGLREQPFGTTPDPRFLYLSASHREALASLVYGIETGRGFVGLIAEPGMGKTTLLFQLMERLQSSARTVFLFQTQTNTREFLSNLIADLGLDPTGQDVASLQRQLNEILLREAQMGRQFVLIIDEAQNLEDSVLESVRMLSNFETARTKLMQIVLAGQPPLADKLARPELEQLRQRVSIICRLEPFTIQEVADYVSHRLEMAGYKGGQLFTPDALSIIAEQSGGIPRNINNMCFHALSLAYAQGQKRIDRAIVEDILDDLELEFVKGRHPKPQAGPRVQKNEQPVLESVMLNDSANSEENDEFKILFRSGSGTRSSTSPRRRTVSGGRQPKPKSPHWLVWAVAMLTLILAGEVLWAYLPANTSPYSVEQFIDAALGRAKQAVLKHQAQNESNAAPLTAPKPTYVNPDNPDNAGVPTESQDASSQDPKNTVKVLSNGQQLDGVVPEDERTAAGSSGDSGSANVAPARSTSRRVSRNHFHGSLSVDHPPAMPAVAKGKIILESNVNGGAITIDGRNEPSWQTPHEFSLPPGSYRISISKSGYSTWFRDVRVASGRKRWIVAHLHAPRGVVVIDTVPPGMQVYIDGKSYGPSEVEASLSVGRHTYEVVPLGGRKPVTGTFVLKPGAILTRKIRWFSDGGRSAAQNTANPEHLRNSATSKAGRERS